MYEDVEIEISERVATISLNRPGRRNAVRLQTLSELRAALTQAEASADVAVIVLTGAGKDFCVGLDAAELTAATGRADNPFERVAELTRARAKGQGFEAEFAGDFDYLLRLRKPVIAAVNGAAAGLGLVLASYSDIRLAGDDARFTASFAQRGLAAEYGLSWLLPRLVGTSNTFRLLWEPSPIRAVAAQQMGLVSFVFPATSLLGEAQAYARRMADASSGHSMTTMKEQVYRDLNSPFSEAYQRTLAAMAKCVAHPDFIEGVTSFLEKRAPDFAPVSAD